MRLRVNARASDGATISKEVDVPLRIDLLDYYDQDVIEAKVCGVLGAVCDILDMEIVDVNVGCPA